MQDRHILDPYQLVLHNIQRNKQHLDTSDSYVREHNGIDNPAYTSSSQYFKHTDLGQRPQVSTPTHGDSKKYPCQTCNTTFARLSHLYRHQRKHIEKHPCQCKECRQTRTSSILDKYWPTSGQQPHDADTVMWNSSGRSLHKKIYECSFCKKGFKKQCRLTAHMTSSHRGQSSHTCNLCEIKFSDKRTFYKHAKLHAKQTQLQYQTLQAFEDEINSAMTGPIHRCTLCELRFDKFLDLNNHFKTHTEDNVHKCGMCGQMCGQKDVLDNHMKLHRELKSEQCKVCLRLFMNMTELNKHKSKHVKRPYQCHLCFVILLSTILWWWTFYMIMDKPY